MCLIISNYHVCGHDGTKHSCKAPTYAEPHPWEPKTYVLSFPCPVCLGLPSLPGQFPQLPVVPTTIGRFPIHWLLPDQALFLAQTLCPVVPQGNSPIYPFKSTIPYLGSPQGTVPAQYHQVSAPLLYSALFQPGPVQSMTVTLNTHSIQAPPNLISRSAGFEDYLSLHPRGVASWPVRQTQIQPQAQFQHLAHLQDQFQPPSTSPLDFQAGNVPSWVPREIRGKASSLPISPAPAFNSLQPGSRRGFNREHGFDDGPLPPGWTNSRAAQAEAQASTIRASEQAPQTTTRTPVSLTPAPEMVQIPPSSSALFPENIDAAARSGSFSTERPRGVKHVAFVTDHDERAPVLL